MSTNKRKLVAELRIYARSLCRNKSEADAIIQEALEITLHNFSEIPTTTSLRTNVFRIIRKIYYGTIAYRKFDGHKFKMYPICLYHCALGEDSHSTAQGIESAIQQLPIHYREAIVLMLILNQSPGSAATIMECDVRTAEYRLDQAQRILQIQVFSLNTSLQMSWREISRFNSQGQKGEERSGADFCFSSANLAEPGGVTIHFKNFHIVRRPVKQ